MRSIAVSEDDSQTNCPRSGMDRISSRWLQALVVVAVIGGILAVLSIRLARTDGSTIGVPGQQGEITDAARVLSVEDTERIGDLMRAYERTTGKTVAVLTVRNLPESIESFALRVIEEWKLGGTRSRDCVLVLVAINDRKVRLEVGSHLSSYITDQQAGDIIDQQMIPSFRNGDYANGILAGLRRALGMIERGCCEQAKQGNAHPEVDERRFGFEGHIFA